MQVVLQQIVDAVVARYQILLANTLSMVQTKQFTGFQLTFAGNYLYIQCISEYDAVIFNMA